jgi:hypothetical protein
VTGHRTSHLGGNLEEWVEGAVVSRKVVHRRMELETHGTRRQTLLNFDAGGFSRPYPYQREEPGCGTINAVQSTIIDP